MSTDAPVDAEILAEIPNLAIHKGTPRLLLRGKGGEMDGCFALGQTVGGKAELISEWVREEKVVNGALRVLAGDQQAITDPKALRHIAIALAGIFVAAERRRMGTDDSKGTDEQTGKPA
jgi:hypothetical protein